MEMPPDKIWAYTLFTGGSLVDTTNTGLLLTIALSPRTYLQQGKPKTYGVEMWDTQLLGLVGGGNSCVPEGLHQAVRLL